MQGLWLSVVSSAVQRHRLVLRHVFLFDEHGHRTVTTEELGTVKNSRQRPINKVDANDRALGADVKHR